MKKEDCSFFNTQLKLAWILAGVILCSFSLTLSAQTFQCEAYTANSGCSISSANTGSTGGYVDMGGNGTWFELNNVNVVSSGTY